VGITVAGAGRQRRPDNQASPVALPERSVTPAKGGRTAAMENLYVKKLDALRREVAESLRSKEPEAAAWLDKAWFVPVTRHGEECIAVHFDQTDKRYHIYRKAYLDSTSEEDIFLDMQQRAQYLGGLAEKA
jgi:hypothetical protein